MVLMRPYEIMVILDPTLDERTVAPSLEAFLNVVRKDGGSVDKVDIWGRRRLAYEIAKHAEGIYAVVDVKAEPGDRVRAGPSAQPERVRAADQGYADRQALSPNGCRVSGALRRLAPNKLPTTLRRNSWLVTPSSPSSET